MSILAACNDPHVTWPSAVMVVGLAAVVLAFFAFVVWIASGRNR